MPLLEALGFAGLTGGLNALSTGLNNRANMRLAEYKYQKDLEMWNLQNEYNSPTNQMQRLSAAGLSPHLVYGGGNTTGNSAGSAPQYSAPRLNPVPVPDMMGQYVSAVKTKNESDLTRAQIGAVSADTLNKLAQNPGLISDSAMKTELAKGASVIANATIQNASLSTQETQNRIALQALDKDLKQFEVNLSKQGFTKNDESWIRMTIQQLQNMGVPLEQIQEKFRNNGLTRAWNKAIGKEGK